MIFGRVTGAFATLRAVHRAYGSRGIARRLRHELRKRTGYHTHPLLPLPSAGNRVLTVHGPRLQEAVREAAKDRGERIVRNEHQAYGDAWRTLPTGAAWQRHPLTGVPYPVVPWWKIRHVDPAVGDIKDTWEPARFGWTYDLIRAAAVYPGVQKAFFFAMLDDFLQSNPPYQGVQWSCGQETSMRAAAWLWAEAVWGWPQDTEPEPRARLAQALWISGERIADAIGYALSQRNNHALWESAALAAIGARFAGDSSVADRWLRDGFSYFEEAVLDQFDTDGWYAQHSFTYTRVALQAAVLIQLVARSVGRGLAPEVVRRIRAANLLLHAVHDERTGDVPNYGANDGANPMSFSSSGYRDFRPIITAVAVAFDQEIPAPFTPDRETEGWLGRTVRIAGTRPSLVRGDGWVVARAGSARLFARAGRYPARPGHLDPLHVELSFGSRAHAIDAGTFRYSAPPPWNDGLRVTAVHNTIDIPAHPIARRGPGFMSIGAPVAEITSVTQRGDDHLLALHNDSWAHLGITHRREIRLSADNCQVEDMLVAPPGTVATLHWLTPTDRQQPRVEADVPLETTRVAGDEGSVLGWRSLYYASKVPAISMTRQFTVPASGMVKLTSTFTADEP